MNYENATNTELNQSLARILYDFDGWELSGFGDSFYRFGANGTAMCAQSISDYCADWSATMPLAIEHGVELSPCCNGWWFAGVVESYTREEDPLSFAGVTICKFPLRAIVICLIKKLESKK
jgi:hypothetical protein